jgi:GT2 family glycosyltransferase/peptidoglycan hydrolase CwlO-like protein
MKTLFDFYEAHTGKVSDKWALYLREYDRLFASYREQPISMLEIGIQNGGSLEIWSQYFTNAEKFVGCDINPDCSKLTYLDPRIVVIVGDATTPETQSKVLAKSASFDLIIEDGSHTSSDIVKAFARYFPALKTGGLFVAEDLHCSYWDGFEGGLFHPYSSITFFKHLADMVNHEHWGVEKSRTELVSGFKQVLNVDFDENLLKQISSVEFVNSICVVRKNDLALNCLGGRIIAGKSESVAGGHLSIAGTKLKAPVQTSNIWSSLGRPPAENYQDQIQDIKIGEELLEQQRELVRQIRNEVDATQGEVKRLKNDVQSKHDEVERLKNDVQSKHDEVERLQSDIQAKQMMVEQLQSDIQAKQTMIEQLRQDFQAKHIDVTNLNNIISAMQSSRSWRYTAALRKAGSFARPVIRKIRIIKNLALSSVSNAEFIYKAKSTKEKIKLIKNKCEKIGYKNTYLKILNLIKIYGILNSIKILKFKLSHFFEKNELNRVDKVEWFSIQPNDSNVDFQGKGVISVIIPVYKGVVETRKCIESVFNSRNIVKYRLIVINDCSPNPGMGQLLNDLKDEYNFELHSNIQNLGFVKTVNFGMSLYKQSDVILLNSDTIVSDYWIDRICAHAFNNSNIATVTPFSNNATICSYPSIYGRKELPNSLSVKKISDELYGLHSGHYVEVPTGVGFCMYIARKAIGLVGLFDEKAFGKGYGEENDFCMKCLQIGLINILALDVFVEHTGEVSFQSDSNVGKQNALNIINKRYPNYSQLIHEHLSAGLSMPYKLNLTQSIFEIGNVNSVLILTHNLGGGTEKYIKDFMFKNQESNYVLVRPDGVNFKVEYVIQGEVLNFSVSRSCDEFMTRLKKIKFNSVYVNHLIDFEQFELRRFTKLGDYIITLLHDYYMICTNINMLKDGRYCESNVINECLDCFKKLDPKFANGFVRNFNSREILWASDQVISPSNYTKKIISERFDFDGIKVLGHESLGSIEYKKINNVQSIITVCIIGVLARHKGLDFVREVAKYIIKNKIKIKIKLIGYVEGGEIIEGLESTGRYDDDDLANLLNDINPTLIWFPAIWPETYSYTLTKAIESGLPIIAPKLGAFDERLKNYQIKKFATYPIDASLVLASFYELLEMTKNNTIEKYNEPESEVSTNYSAVMNDIKSNSKINKILLIPESDANFLSPCAYIRMLLPIICTRRVSNCRYFVGSVDDALTGEYDTIYTHRIAIDPEKLDLFTKICETKKIDLHYDLDDDLIGIAESDHPERDFYSKLKPGLIKLIEIANEVTVSTLELRTKIQVYKSNATVRPNKLYRDLWLRDPFENNSKSIINIIYMGTLTHVNDVKIVIPALQKIYEKYKYKVKVSTIGVSPNLAQYEFINVIDIPPWAGESYITFVDWIKSLGRFDIGVAPLVDNDFNRSKSDIKYLDYTAIGAVTIASSVEAYKHSIASMENGILVENKTDDWFVAVEKLIEDESLRAKLYSNALKFLDGRMY